MILNSSPASARRIFFSRSLELKATYNLSGSIVPSHLPPPANVVFVG